MTVTKLNFIPATFSVHEIAGFVLNYENSDQLKALQDNYKGHYLFRRDAERGVIRAVPISDQCKPLPGHAKTEQFSASTDYYLFSALLEESVRRFLRSKQY